MGITFRRTAWPRDVRLIEKPSRLWFHVPVPGIHRTLWERSIDGIEHGGQSSRIQEDDVVYPAVVFGTLLGITVSVRTLPDNLVGESLRAEDCVHQYL